MVAVVVTVGCKVVAVTATVDDGLWMFLSSMVVVVLVTMVVVVVGLINLAAVSKYGSNWYANEVTEPTCCCALSIEVRRAYNFDVINGIVCFGQYHNSFVFVYECILCGVFIFSCMKKMYRFVVYGCFVCVCVWVYLC